MAADQLTKALLLEEVAPPRKVAEALFASVNGGVPLLQSLVDSGTVSPDVLARYLARASNEAPFLRQVVPLLELVERLPQGLCARLLAIPVRRDAITNTIDVVVADPSDPHPANEIAFHLGAPVRAIRAPLAALEEALRRLRMSSPEHRGSIPAPSLAARFQEAARAADGELYDSRPSARAIDTREGWANSFPARTDARAGARPATVPPPLPELSRSLPVQREGSAREAGQAAPAGAGLVLEPDSVPPPPPQPYPPPPARIRTPPWGTPVHVLRETTHRRAPASDPPQSGYGSEIPIPLTRKTVHPAMPHPPRNRTQRLAAPARPAANSLGEGYAIDTTNLRDVVERTPSRGVSLPAAGQPAGSFIPGPPPLPGASGFAAFAPQLPFAEMHGVLAALRNAGSRDEVLELVLTGARMVALKVALFVVKKGGYLGWAGTPELADRAALQSVLIPLDSNSIFDRAVREDLYLGPIRQDDVHAPLLRVLQSPSRDVAAVPIRVSGKTAVIIVADELGDTMLSTRRLEELARAAGEAFARIVRTRR